jgi:hypothetical protein
MFDDDERRILLMHLWEYKMRVEQSMSGADMPVDKAEAYRYELALRDVIVKKLGGDPTKPAFGL